MKTINSSFLLGILNFFCIIYRLHFYLFYRTPPIWKCFGNFVAFTSWISKHSTIKGTIDIKSDTWGWMVVSGIPGIKSFFSNLLNSSGIRHFVLWLGCLAGDKPSPSHLSQPSYPTYSRFIIVTLAILVATGVPVIPIILRIPVIESFTLFHLP